MSDLRQKTGRIGLGMAIVAGTVGVFASPAYASLASCRSGRQACLFEDFGWQGSQYATKTAVGRYELDGFNGDNEISSITNYTPFCLNVYTNDNFQGRILTIWKFTGLNAPEIEVGNLDDLDFDNDIESYELFRC